MCDHFRARAIITALVPFVGLLMACEGRPPSAPTPPAPTAMSVSSISPVSGPTIWSTSLTISGTGFVSGAAVTLGGIPTEATVVTSGVITTTAPTHDAGTVDLVVTNPDGQSSRLSGAFTYFVPRYTLTPATNRAIAGSPLSVSWTVDVASPLDWIGLFKAGDPSTTLDHGWNYTYGGTSGALTFTAPMGAGPLRVPLSVA